MCWGKNTRPSPRRRRFSSWQHRLRLDPKKKDFYLHITYSYIHIRKVFSEFNPSLVIKEQWAATGGSVTCSWTRRHATNGDSGDWTNHSSPLSYSSTAMQPMDRGKTDSWQKYIYNVISKSIVSNKILFYPILELPDLLFIVFVLKLLLFLVIKSRWAGENFVYKWSYY